MVLISCSSSTVYFQDAYVHYFNEYWNCHKSSEHQIQLNNRNALCPVQPKHCITISSSLNFLYLWQIFTADNLNCTPYALTISIILLQIILRCIRFNGIPAHFEDCKCIHEVSAERRIYVVHSELANARPPVCPPCYVTHDNMLPVKGIFTCRTQNNMMWSTHCHFQITSSAGNKFGGDTQHTVWQTLRDPTPRNCKWCYSWHTLRHCMWCYSWPTPRQCTCCFGGFTPSEYKCRILGSSIQDWWEHEQCLIFGSWRNGTKTKSVMDIWLKYM